MRINLRKKKNLTDEQLEIIDAKDFFDRTVPGIIRFYTDHYICGNFYKSCWAVTEYPTSTEETAILAHLADRNGVFLTQSHSRTLYIFMDSTADSEPWTVFLATERTAAGGGMWG